MAYVSRTLVARVGLMVAILEGGVAEAADQGLTGKKLLLKSTPKLVLLSKDATISIAGSDPINGADSSISFDAGGGPVTFSLPAAGWSTNGSTTLFKYKNASAPGGPSAVKIAKVKPGLLKVVAKGLPFPVPNGAATIDVVLSLDGGTNTYCMTFAGTGDGDKFLVKDAPAGSCPTPFCPSFGVAVGGFCWYLSSAGSSCDVSCGFRGLSCDTAGTVNYAGTGGTLAQCDAVLDALDGPGVVMGDSTSGADLGCAILFGLRFRDITMPTTCAGAFSMVERACACQ